jgi:hypothetical protein
MVSILLFAGGWYLIAQGYALRSAIEAGYVDPQRYGDPHDSIVAGGVAATLGAILLPFNV